MDESPPLDLFGQGVLIEVLSTMSIANEAANEVMHQTTAGKSQLANLEMQASSLMQRFESLKSQTGVAKTSFDHVKQLMEHVRFSQIRQCQRRRGKAIRVIESNDQTIASLQAEYERKLRISQELDVQVEQCEDMEGDLRAEQSKLLVECSIAQACLADRDFERIEAEIHKAEEHVPFYQYLYSTQPGVSGAEEKRETLPDGRPPKMPSFPNW
jgi:chromosome segregation ATPase